jgi:hypothetical protein
VPFRFPCYRDFKFELGQFDAICEMIELARRELEGQAKASNNVVQFIAGLSNKHKVRVNTFDGDELAAQTARFYVVSVHQRFDDFLLDLKKEHPDGHNWNLDGKEGRLLKLARAVNFKHTLEFDVCEYYRKVRNGTVHAEARDKLAKGDDKLRQRVQAGGGATSYAKLNAPSAYDEVSFDDFILFSRCAKNLAEQLCIHTRPSPAALVKLTDDADEVKNLASRFKDKPDRIAKLRTKHLRREFSLDSDEAREVLEECSLA